MAVTDRHAEILSMLAFGSVLETGYGTGKSSRAMATSKRVTSITSWEPDNRFCPELTGSSKISVLSGERWPTDGDYDFVFLDHWPLPGETRKEAARHWAQRGALVLVDDADIEPLLHDEAYRIENMWILGGR